MKKLLVVFLLVSVWGFSQAPISPYYPEPLNHGRYLTPVTFVELNHVSMKFQDFLADRYRMVIVDSKYNIIDGNGNVIFDYSSGLISNSESKLKFNFKVFSIDHHLIIESITITGDLPTLFAFFVDYWPTKITVEDLKNTKLGTSKYYMDLVEFDINRIFITNSTISSPEEFLSLFETKTKTSNLQAVDQTAKSGVLPPQ